MTNPNVKKEKEVVLVHSSLSCVNISLEHIDKSDAFVEPQQLFTYKNHIANTRKPVVPQLKHTH